ncbi:helix-turn-helix domain-containing protein [Streptomyces sp. NPDC054987]
MVGNHLLQHRQMSATAIGVGAYIQSLPEGSPVGVKVLAERFPEGEIRIGSALRELERHGYLERRRERLDCGRLVTRTYSYNRPTTSTPAPHAPPPLPPSPPPPPPPPPPVPPPPRALPPAREPVPAPAPVPVPAPERAPDPAGAPEPVPAPVPEHVPAPVPEPVPAPVPEAVPAPAPDDPPPPTPLHPGAADLLAGLRRYDPQLLLSEHDVRWLAPLVSTWLERGVEPGAVERALSFDLPAGMRRPAAVLAYRLTNLLPPPLPPAPPPPPEVRPSRRPDPYQNCDGCDRAFRAPAPGPLQKMFA